MKRRAGLMVVLVTAFALVAAACTSDGGGDTQAAGTTGAGEPVKIVLWHGYGKVAQPDQLPNLEANSMQALIDEWNAANPDIQVQNVFCCNNDRALEKLTVALQGGKQPDITYQYGSSMPQLAQAPNIMDLTDRVADPDFNWNDFFPGARTAATVDGRVLGIPALIDNLAIVYNKDLFDQAGIDYPTADWTWDDFRAAAKELTDPAKKQFGFAFPADATEDTVWHFEAMLWEAGGDILNADNTKAEFNSEAGVTALTMLRDMAVTDESIFLDLQNSKIDNLFNGGKVGMLVTGPWALAGYPDVDYGVEIMPMFAGGNHQTISGPDNWVLFDNGEARANATWEFMKWFTAREQILKDSLITGHLPTRASVLSMPAFQRFDRKFPGAGVFAQNLENVVKARPVLASYPRISEAMGQAIVSVLLGESEPQAALDEAAAKVDGILAVPE